MNKEIIIDGKGCRYKTWDEDCALTGDNHGDNMEPCKFIDEKNCYHMQLKAKEQECEELKQYQEDAEKVLKNILDNFDKMENRYRKALEEIEKHLKNYLNMQNPAVNEHNDGFNTGIKTAAALVLNIIEKHKAQEAQKVVNCPELLEVQNERML